eukprot:12400452-Karenia_brevis.AAC.1
MITFWDHLGSKLRSLGGLEAILVPSWESWSKLGPMLELGIRVPKPREPVIDMTMMKMFMMMVTIMIMM